MKTYPKPSKRDLERFWTKVDKIPGHGPWGDCWLWIGGTSEGYGMFWFNGRLDRAPRFSYQIAHGVTELWILHRCDIRACINPTHLFPGTRTDNMRDCAIKERINTTILTAAQVSQIKRLLKAGFTHRVIANSFATDRTNVSRIARGETWKHIL